MQTYLKERIREVLTGTSDAIVVRIYGRDLKVLEQKATEVKEALAKIPGIVDLHQAFQEDIPQIEVKVDLTKAQRYGIKPGDVRRAATTMVAGEEVGDIHIANRTYDVNVWSVPEARNSLNALRELLHRYARRRPRAAAGRGRRCASRRRQMSSTVSTSAPDGRERQRAWPPSR